MPCYISSNDNRFYAAIESSYGTVPAITAAAQFPAVKLAVEQRTERVQRRDKTGGRTFGGLPAGLRRETSFHLTTYMTSWGDTNGAPAHDALVQGALGAPGLRFHGATIAGGSGQLLEFASPHGLSLDQAVAFGGEIRFVAAIPDATRVQLNAPFTIAPSPGSPLFPTMTYLPANDLSGVSIFDYWGPSSAVQRIIRGAAINRMWIRINADFHQFEFSGPAADVIDSASFESGQGGLTAYPAEPEGLSFDYSVIPGNLGQVWLGNTPKQVFTLTDGEILIDNDVELRSREFGLQGPRCIVPGRRTVQISFSLYEQGEEVTRELYQAARQRSPISVQIQLGEQPGQLFGVYLKSVVPEVPVFDDSERRLQWRFSGSRAQGTVNDEIAVAFG
jgi:hypothetical protein